MCTPPAGVPKGAKAAGAGSRLLLLLSESAEAAAPLLCRRTEARRLAKSRLAGGSAKAAASLAKAGCLPKRWLAGSGAKTARLPECRLTGRCAEACRLSESRLASRGTEA